MQLLRLKFKPQLIFYCASDDIVVYSSEKWIFTSAHMSFILIQSSCLALTLHFFASVSVFPREYYSTAPLFQSISSSSKVNDYPVILMPGFMGGLNYYGNSRQGYVMDELKKEGYEVFQVMGGPVSSSYDRVVEIYHQIVGGTVDYGAAHSSKYGHSRFAETVEAGLYPEISNTNKVHLISHSFGGVDCRYLTHLLNYGSEAEQVLAAQGEAISPVFEGGHDWIASCTSIASPHDGTVLALLINDYIPVVKTLILSVASVLGLETENCIFDFKLEQW